MTNCSQLGVSRCANPPYRARFVPNDIHQERDAAYALPYQIATISDRTLF